MSAEILNKGPVFPVDDDTKKIWCHDAVHDIESLFWVVVFICLVREGPGTNMLRKELLNNDPKNKTLQDTIYRYFDATEPHEIRHNKTTVLTSNSTIRNEILPQFHQYFEPLKDMMVRWQLIMRLAYNHRKFEYYTIHDQIIDMIKKTMDGLSESQDPRTLKEETRRREERELHLESIRGKNKEPSFGTSDDHESDVNFSPERPIHYRIAAPAAQLRQEPESPSRKFKKPKKN